MPTSDKERKIQEAQVYNEYMDLVSNYKKLMSGLDTGSKISTVNPAAKCVMRIGISENAISCVFEDDNAFSDVAFKVLQNQEKYGIIKCNRAYQNGQIKLVYDVTKFKPLNYIFSVLSRQSFLAVLSNIKTVAAQIKENGFIRLENTFARPDRLFVDVEKLSVHMVCLPTKEALIYKNVQDFYAALHSGLVVSASRLPALADVDVASVLSFTQAAVIAPKQTQPQPTPQPQPCPPALPPLTPKKNKRPFMGRAVRDFNGFVLRSVNSPEQIRFAVNKQEYLIGKKADLFDDTIEMFRTAKDVYRQCREDVFQSTDRLVRVWEGEGEEAFERAYNQLRTRLSDEEDSLRTLAEDFEDMRQSYRDWDSEIAKQLNNQ